MTGKNLEALAGKVAIVGDGGAELGRAIALALSARGVAVVVCGPEEKPLAETVGHVVFGGGKARHVVGSLEAAAARAREVFGRVDIVVGRGAARDEHLGEHRVSVEAPSDVDADHVGALVVALCAAGPGLPGRALALRVE